MLPMTRSTKFEISNAPRSPDRYHCKQSQQTDRKSQAVDEDSLLNLIVVIIIVNASLYITRAQRSSAKIWISSCLHWGMLPKKLLLDKLRELMDAKLMEQSTVNAQLPTANNGRKSEERSRFFSYDRFPKLDGTAPTQSLRLTG
ncbi:hypothetical protein BHE74_00040002 [Ensete ventricosum]|nr:hypothetical protein BHE74_00040002 [Ensete ventricosum]